MPHSTWLSACEPEGSAPETSSIATRSAVASPEENLLETRCDVIRGNGSCFKYKLAYHVGDVFEFFFFRSLDLETVFCSHTVSERLDV